MRIRLGLALVGGLALAGGAAQAAPTLEVRNAMARVTVIPEARQDVAVSVVKANPRLPLRVRRQGDRVIVDGALLWPGVNCKTVAGRAGATQWGLGDVSIEAMPQVVVRTPRNARIDVSGAVFGAVGPGDSVDFANAGCGDWTIADQAGSVAARLAGSGDVRAGSAASADVRISGSADVSLANVRQGLSAAIAGSGDVSAVTVNGPLKVRIAGSGDVRIRGGTITDMDVATTGSGDVRFGGVAGALTARLVGSGDVSVARVTGPVVKHIAGSGGVSIGR